MTIDNGLRCWKCAAPVGDEPRPWSRSAECPDCRASLHVCMMCEFFDRQAPNACLEPVAEAVAEKARANFCGYFEPNPHLFSADRASQQAARAAADALFGDAPREPAATSDARQRFEDLFK